MKKLFAALLAAFAIVAGAQTPFLSVASSPTGASGSVTSVSVTPSNGVTGTVTTPTSTPAIALTLGNITPTSVTTGTVTVTTINGTPTIASPTLVTPTLGVASATSVNKVTLTAPATGSTLTISDGKTLAATNSITLSGTDGKTYTLPAQTSSVPPYIGTTTYANLVSSWPCNGTWNGFKAFVSDWGANGTEARCNGTRWLPLNGQVILKRMGAAVSSIGNTITIVVQVQLPAGVLQVGDVIRIYDAATKSGTTDNFNNYFYVGTAGTTSDTAVVSAFNQMNAAATAGGFVHGFRVTSNTLIQKTGGNVAASSPYGGVGATAAPAAVTVVDLSANSVWLSFAVRSAGTTDTVGVQEVTIIQEAG